MICPNCKIDLTQNNFLPNQEICFKCTYKAKTAKKIIPPKLCRLCKQEILFDENLKKRQRTVFCSEKCALKGQKNKNENHWTRKLRVHLSC